MLLLLLLLNGTTFATLGGGRSAVWLNSDSPVCTCPSLSNKDVIVFDVSEDYWFVPAAKIIRFVGAKYGRDANELRLLSRCLFLGLVVVAAPHYYLFRLQTTRQINLATSLDVHLVSLRLVPIVVDAAVSFIFHPNLSNNAVFTNPFILLVSLLSGFGNFRRTWRNISFSRFRSPPLTNAYLFRRKRTRTHTLH